MYSWSVKERCCCVSSSIYSHTYRSMLFSLWQASSICDSCKPRLFFIISIYMLTTYISLAFHYYLLSSQSQSIPVSDLKDCVFILRAFCILFLNPQRLLTSLGLRYDVRWSWDVLLLLLFCFCLGDHHHFLFEGSVEADVGLACGGHHVVGAGRAVAAPCPV